MLKALGIFKVWAKSRLFWVFFSTCHVNVRCIFKKALFYTQPLVCTDGCIAMRQINSYIGLEGKTFPLLGFESIAFLLKLLHLKPILSIWYCLFLYVMLGGEAFFFSVGSNWNQNGSPTKSHLSSFHVHHLDSSFPRSYASTSVRAVQYRSQIQQAKTLKGSVKLFFK